MQDTLVETEPQISGTMVAVIIISSIAAVCLFALTILLVSNLCSFLKFYLNSG